MLMSIQPIFFCYKRTFVIANKKRKENNKKIQRHVIMKSCCLWTYYLNIENKVTYSSPFSTCQNVIWTSSSNQMITIGTSMFSILSVVFKTGQKCTTKHSEMLFENYRIQFYQISKILPCKTTSYTQITSLFALHFFDLSFASLVATWTSDCRWPFAQIHSFCSCSL